MSKVLILGGAGFIGSNIAEYFVSKNDKVVVLDGLMGKTGGSKRNLERINNKIEIYYSNIKGAPYLKSLITNSEIIIDCMAWTSHHSAIEDPLYDMELNCSSHLYLINLLREAGGKKIIFISSRGIYGNVENNKIDEHTPLNPIDIQGIHKLTGETYFKIYSKNYGFNIVSLRIPNCFGENQPYEGEDIGLIGSFIRNALLNKKIEVFGEDRKRSLIFAADVARIVWLISRKEWGGFIPLNINGLSKPIIELADNIVSIIGGGEIILKEMPSSIRNIDIGNIIIDDSRLKEFIGDYSLSEFQESLTVTINYFKKIAL
ncbi:MAG: SDR family oxidoreductase [Bacteroidales bacterium]